MNASPRTFENPDAASRSGYVQVTRAYYGAELPMLDRVVADFRGIETALVKAFGGIQLWRRGPEPRHRASPEQILAGLKRITSK